MNIGLLVIICLLCIEVGASLAKHGEQKDLKYNFWTSLISAIIWLLLIKWAGGF